MSGSSLLGWFQSGSEPSVLLLDGGVSTYLEYVLKERNEVFSHRSLWSSSLLLDGNQGDVQAMHRAFRNAGADILSTVTYQCHFDGTEVSNEVMTRMLRDGVRWARQATPGGYVAASSGCYGGALADGSEYTGDYGDVTLQQLVDFHVRKFRVLAEEAPDAIAIETIPNLLECRAILTMLNKQDLAVPCWISFACQDGDRLNDGSRMEAALDILEEMDPTATVVHGVGINCCDSLHVPSLLAQLVHHMARHNCRRVIAVYPNSGERWDAQQSMWKEGTGCTSSDEFADRMINAMELVQSTWKTARPDDMAPKMILGGCCRTSPTTIAAIRRRLDEQETCPTKEQVYKLR